MNRTTAQPPGGVVCTQLPGPDRKRSPRPYHYRLLYRNPNPTAVGCAIAWEVSGGRLDYQVAVELKENGTLRLHCTCADAIFRAENEGRFCKHVHGLLLCGRQPVRLQQWASAGA